MLDSVLEKNRSYLQNTDSEVYDALIGEEKRQKIAHRTKAQVVVIQSGGRLAASRQGVAHKDTKRKCTFR